MTKEVTIDRMTGVLLDTEPFYNPFMSITDIGYSDQAPTMEVAWRGGRICISVSRSFLARLTLHQALFVLRHEFAHVYLGHLMESRARPMIDRLSLAYPQASAKTRMGILGRALDLEINSTVLVRQKEEAPEGVFAEMYGFEPGLLAEEYLKLLIELIDQSPKCPTCGAVHLDVAGEDKSDENGDKSDENRPACPDCGAPLQGDGHKDETGPFINDRFTPDIGENTEFGDPIDEADISDRFRDGASRGDSPGGAEVVLKNLRPPQLRWPKLLIADMLTAIRTNSTLTTYSRLNRRLRTKGLPGRVFKSPPEVWVFQDTSGSMSVRQMELTASELSGIRKHTSRVMVVVVDAAVQTVYEFNGTLEPAKGRGGSDFCPAFAYMKENSSPSARKIVILMTDGDISVPPPDEVRGLDIIWLLADGPRTVPYGSSIIMDEEVR